MTPQTRTAAWLAGVAGGMLALSFAAVPLYDLFCRVTGYGGTTSVSTVAPDQILDRTVTVRFDASVAAGMPWIFKPQQLTMELRIGETGLAFYEAYNPTDHAVAGTASYNVQPDLAGGYFTKIECFCFTEQTLQPGETVSMPVVFYVDPEIKRDSDTARVYEIALSYTFYEKAAPQPQASLPPAQKPAYN